MPRSRTASPAQLANLRPAKKGEPSRNPLGRPKGSKDRRTLGAEAHLEELKTKVNHLPLDFLLLEMNNESNSMHLRFKCAVELLPYCHRRLPAATEEDITPKSTGAIIINPSDLASMPVDELATLLSKLEDIGGAV